MTAATGNAGAGTTVRKVNVSGGAVARQRGNLPESGQVSFVVMHRVAPDRREQYEEWLRAIIGEAAKFPGHQGVHVVRPGPEREVYEILVRFASRKDAENWMNSQIRRDLVEQAGLLIAEPEKLNILSGIDYWFTAATRGTPPKRWKQWLSTVSVIWPLSILLPILLDRLFHAIPLLGAFGVSQLIAAMCMVGLLVYVVMPPYTRLLDRWLAT